MNYFDEAIINFLNSFSRVSDTFDYLMTLLVRNNLIKSGILVTILWWLWFRDEKNQSNVNGKGGGKIKEDRNEKKNEQQN